VEVEYRRFDDRILGFIVFHSIEDDTELGHVLSVHGCVRADEADSPVALEEQGIRDR
jgi:phenylalanyl-tRNA synthetase beta subunit